MMFGIKWEAHVKFRAFFIDIAKFDESGVIPLLKSDSTLVPQLPIGQAVTVLDKRGVKVVLTLVKQ